MDKQPKSAKASNGKKGSAESVDKTFGKK